MTLKHNGVKIHERLISELYLKLPAPLGLDYEKERKEFEEDIKILNKDIKAEEMQAKVDKFYVKQKQEAEKRIMMMNIFCDYDGFIYFNEILFFFFKFALQESVY